MAENPILFVMQPNMASSLEVWTLDALRSIDPALCPPLLHKGRDWAISHPQLARSVALRRCSLAAFRINV